MSINDPEILKKIEKRIEETDWDDYFKREKEKRKQGFLRVANTEYCNWLESFIANCVDGYEDERFHYNSLQTIQPFTETDYKNEKDLLEHFHFFIGVVADIQRIKEYYDDRDGYPEYEYVFKYNNKYYEYNTLVGQGSITRISELTEKPDFAVIDLDLYFKREEEGHPMRKYKYYYEDEENLFDEFDEDEIF